MYQKPEPKTKHTYFLLTPTKSLAARDRECKVPPQHLMLSGFFLSVVLTVLRKELRIKAYSEEACWTANAGRRP
jgi:hypothetical protein